MSKIKKCFFIAPIGSEGSEIRKRSNQIFDHVISLAARECGYEAGRADQMDNPGIITHQIIQRLMDDDLVIADLTNNNPNVTYELALRHAFRKHVILIKDLSDTLPFDLGGIRTIDVDYRFIDSMRACKEAIIRGIKAIESNPSHIESPVNTALYLKSIGKDDAQAQINIEILSQLQNMKAEMGRLGAAVQWGLKPSQLAQFQKVRGVNVNLEELFWGEKEEKSDAEK